MKLYKNIFLLLSTLFFLMCCAQIEGNDSKNQKAAAAKMSSILDNNSLAEKNVANRGAFNLAEDRKYNYVKECYRESGQTPENASQLFNDLENAREIAMHNLRRSYSSDDAANDRDFMISSVYSHKGRFYVTAASTVKDNSKSSYIRLKIKDQNANLLSKGPGGWIMEQGFTDGKCFFFTVDLPLPSQKAGYIEIEGLEVLTLKDTTTEYRNVFVKSIVEDDYPGILEKILVEHPADKNNDGKICISLKEGITANHDYAPLSQDEFKIKVPFKGCIQLPYKINPAQVNRENTFINLVGPLNQEEASIEYQGLDGSFFADALKFTDGPNTSTFIEWDISREECSFDHSILFDRLGVVNWYINLSFNDVETFPGWIEPRMDYCASNDTAAGNLIQGYYPPHLELIY